MRMASPLRRLNLCRERDNRPAVAALTPGERRGMIGGHRNRGARVPLQEVRLMTIRIAKMAAIAGSLALPLCLSALALPSPAAAQQAAYQMPRAPVGSPARTTGGQESWRFESEEMRRRNAMTPEEAEAEYGVERVQLSERIQALINERKCREARAMANEAG